MKEEFGDFWDLLDNADAGCITTNGSLVRLTQGRFRGVMGRGIARQAKQRYPDLEARLGAHIGEYGNHVGVFHAGLVAFPVKHTWEQKADLTLIERSAGELILLAHKRNWQRVLLPRPGCGNGGLRWEDVRPLLTELLPDTVVIVEYPDVQQSS